MVQSDSCKISLIGLATALLLAVSCIRSPGPVASPEGGPDSEGDFDIVLPSASEARPLLIVEPNEIVIRIDLEGRVFVEGEEFSVDELEDYLVAVTADDSLQHNASIRADGQCQLSDVVRVIDLCNRVGISHHLSATFE